MPIDTIISRNNDSVINILRIKPIIKVRIDTTRKGKNRYLKKKQYCKLQFLWLKYRIILPPNKFQDIIHII